MSDYCCFDTSFISYLFVTKSQEPDLERKRRKTEGFINQLRKSKSTLCLSSIVVSELLLAFPDKNERKNVLELILRQFQISSYDAQCAERAAELLFDNGYQESRNKSQTKERNYVKEDVKIFAVAMNDNATHFFTNDIKHFSKYANSQIKILSLEDIALQEQLFESVDSSFNEN